jgi:hypothetical protein
MGGYARTTSYLVCPGATRYVVLWPDPLKPFCFNAKKGSFKKSFIFLQVHETAFAICAFKTCKTLYHGRDLNPRSEVLVAEVMTALPRCNSSTTYMRVQYKESIKVLLGRYISRNVHTLKKSKHVNFSLITLVLNFGLKLGRFNRNSSNPSSSNPSSSNFEKRHFVEPQVRRMGQFVELLQHRTHNFVRTLI